MNQQEILKRTSIINVKNKLELTEIYSQKDIIYVECPFCVSKRGTMKLNTSNNGYICKECENRGYAIGLYAKCKHISNKQAYKELIREKANMTNQLVTVITTNTRKSNEELDSVYQSFVEKLTLSEQHTTKLLQYGFTIEEIRKIGFRTIPTTERDKILICKKLINDGLDLRGIPGFYKDKNFNWNFKSHKGIFVPILDNCRIIGLRIHLDSNYNIDTTDIWFSSSQENDGTKADNSIMFLLPEESKIQLINKRKERDIVIASEFLLAYKIATIYKNTIIIGIPNIISKAEIKKIDIFRHAENVFVIQDRHTMLHNSENLISTLINKFGEENIKLGVSYKNCEIPENLKSYLNQKELKEKIIA